MFEIRILESQRSVETSIVLPHDWGREVVPLVLAIQNERNKFTAGLIGNTYQEFAMVSLLWFASDTVRKQCGARLIEEFEILATNRQCTVIFVEEKCDANVVVYREAGYAPAEGLAGFIKEFESRRYIKRIGPTMMKP